MYYLPTIGKRQLQRWKYINVLFTYHWEETASEMEVYKCIIYLPLGRDSFRDGSILLKMISNSMGWCGTDQAG